MRRVKLIGAAITAAVAISAVASAISSAALPEFNPSSGTFTSAAGPGTLQFKGGNTIECASGTNKGQITGAKTATVTIEFAGCKLFGIINAKSLGDATSGVILTTATGELCYIEKATRKVGLRLTATGKVHIEVGTSLAVVEGTLIGEVKPVNKKEVRGELVLTQSGGAQSVSKCEGGATELLKGSENEGATKEAGEQTTDKITYATATEVLA